MYLYIYQCSQAYGGPEEGGWWYSCGELIDSKRISNLTRARQTVKELNKKFKNDDKGEYQMGFGGFDGCDDSGEGDDDYLMFCLLYTSPSPRDLSTSRMPSSA